jgi:hypothetical protein
MCSPETHTRTHTRSKEVDSARSSRSGFLFGTDRPIESAVETKGEAKRPAVFGLAGPEADG